MNLKNKIDYIYEYSDLNLFQTRVKILTGDYANIILEFGGSAVTQRSDTPGGEFNFDYTLYYKPDNLKEVKLLGNKEFEAFLSEVLITIVNDRKDDRNERNKLHEAADNKNVSEIKIDNSFYTEII